MVTTHPAIKTHPLYSLNWLKVTCHIQSPPPYFVGFFFNRLVENTKKLTKLFHEFGNLPDLKILDFLGKKVPAWETYPAVLTRF